jgi:photosystem II stability/assembly factor-like uncharacterized protein
LRAILAQALIIVLLLASGCVPANPALAPGTPPASQITPLSATSAPPTATIPPTQTRPPSPTPAPSATPSLTPPASPASPSLVITPTLTSLHMLDESNGWGLTYQRVLKTTDGGAAWMDVTPAGLSQSASLLAFFLDLKTAWILAASGGDFFNGMLFRTVDGGITWTSVKVPFSGGSLYFLDETHGWDLFASDCGAGSCGGSLYQSSDGGETWTELLKIDQHSNDNPKAIPLAGDKTGITFADQMHGWVSGTEPMDNYAYLFSTQDGGSAWGHQDLSLPQGYTPAQLAVDPPRFFTSQDGLLPVHIFSGEKSGLLFYLTQDGGKTWTPGTPTGVSGSYSFISMQDIWVWDGETMMVTQDGGKTWAKVAPNINLSQIIMQIDFVTQGVGWVITMDADGKGQLLKTLDGGKTWAPVH